MIRALSIDDAALPAVLDLIHAAFADDPDSPSAHMPLERLRELVRQGTALVVEEGGQVLACVLSRASRDMPGSLYFGALAVAQSARRQGLAHRLIEVLEDLARAQGATGMSLDTGADHPHLIGFYERMGFELVRPEGGRVIMFRPLTDSGPRRLTPFDDPVPILTLIRAEFAYMEGRIDPPSSMHRLAPDDVRAQVENGEIWVIGPADAPEACVFLSQKDAALYIGKLAVAAVARGQGHARALVDLAEARARALGLAALTLQTRVELSENHAAFHALGFEKTGETTHPGYGRPTSVTFTKTL